MNFPNTLRHKRSAILDSACTDGSTGIIRPFDSDNLRI